MASSPYGQPRRMTNGADYNRTAMLLAVLEKKMRLPIGILPGVGEKAAADIQKAVDEGNYMSIDDLQIESGVSKSVIESLKSGGALSFLPDTNQMTLF